MSGKRPSMEGRTYRPRNLDLGEMVRVLVQEHAEMRKGLERVREAIGLQDYGLVSAALQDLDPVFRQHIADEESQILRVLIGSLGAKGAADEIRVFQQHRPIHLLMQKISDMASRPTAELPKEREELERLLDSHFLAEEKEVFPKALACDAKSSGPS